MAKYYTCIDCGDIRYYRKEQKPLRCKKCYLIHHYGNGPPKCQKCGKILNLKTPRVVKLCRKCFLESHSTVFKQPEIDDAFGNWLTGFTDGEGCFSYTKNHGQSFRINLREDDKDILEEIRNRLGCGRIHYLEKSKYNKNTRNQYQYGVATLVDLVNIIVPLFNKYKLRAKKRKDFEGFKKKVLNHWEEVMRVA